MNNVRVRLAPKPLNDRAVPSGFAFAATSSELLSEFQPSPSAAAELERRALGHNLSANRSQAQRVDVLVPEGRMGSLSHVDLVERTTSRVDTKSYAGTLARWFRAPSAALKIPSDLADVVEFAYVPTPPEIFAPDPIPPGLNLHLLDLADVVLALKRCSSSSPRLDRPRSARRHDRQQLRPLCTVGARECQGAR